MTKAAASRLLLTLLLIGFGESFSPTLSPSSSSSLAGSSFPTSSVSIQHDGRALRRPRTRRPLLLRSKNDDDDDGGGRRGNRRRGIRRYTDNDGRDVASRKKTRNKRAPHNKRTAIRWAIQGVERSLAEDGNGGDKGKSYRYRRRIDASLVDALYLMADARSRSDVLDAEERIRAVMLATNRDHPPAEFPTEVVERTVKAAAMAGLSSLSSSLLRSLLLPRAHDDDEEGGTTIVPSPMAYTAVMNALRRNGRVDRMEGLLADLAGACRRANGRRRERGDDIDVRAADSAVDIVAFNTYVAALCDAATNGAPFSPSSSRSAGNDSAAIVEGDDDVDEMMMMGELFNFTSLESRTEEDDDRAGPSHATSPIFSSSTSSSERYLYKALNLLQGDSSRRRFALGADPDVYSYNSVLNAAAKCAERAKDDYGNGRNNGDGGDDDDHDGKHFAESVMSRCLRSMEGRNVRPDVLTYNARIRAALARDDEDGAIALIDRLAEDEGCRMDRYTIDFMLRPFIHAGREDDIMTILGEFYDENARGGTRNGGVVSSAFEAYLNTIVRAGEVEFAHGVFRSFFLRPTTTSTAAPGRTNHGRMHVSRTAHVASEEDRPRRKEGASISHRKGSADRRGGGSRPSPRTRHFNILLGGYAKAYQSAASRNRRRSAHHVATSAPNKEGGEEQHGHTPDDNSTVPDIRCAYELLDTMLDSNVPLDAYSVTSLMALPHPSPENVTSLLERIEPEMMVELSPAAYRSVGTAYGRAGDPSSACWMFEEMIRTRSKSNNGGRSRAQEDWNAMLGALAKCAGPSDGGASDALDVLHSRAALARRSEEIDESGFVPLVNGKTCLDASMAVLDAMRVGMAMHPRCTAPKPNSQTYCLIASTLSSGSGATSSSESDDAPADLALDLFRNATAEGVPADGRFLNAVLRCFGDDVEGALAAWKGIIGPSAAAHERTSNKGGSNVMAAYNGLMHVCGRAIRPDVATRIAYAMGKAGVEPTEVTLNSYLAGKRMALEGIDNGKNLVLRNQYESLLSVECTKYNSRDKRRTGDKKIRIILSN